MDASLQRAVSGELWPLSARRVVAETATHVHFELPPHFGLFLPEYCGLRSCVAAFHIEEPESEALYLFLDLRSVLFKERSSARLCSVSRACDETHFFLFRYPRRFPPPLSVALCFRFRAKCLW